MPDLQMSNLNHICIIKALAAISNDIYSEPNIINKASNGTDANHWKDSRPETKAGSY